MSILDIFRSAPTEQPATTPPTAPVDSAAPAPPGNIPDPTTVVATSPGAEPNGVVPATPAVPATPEVKDESPLAPFKDLWENKPTEKGKEAPPVVELTAEALQKTMVNANFASVITPEQLTAITAGGKEATKAFQEAMNAVSKNVMVQATLVGNKLTEKAVNDAIKAHTDSLPELLRKQASSDHLKTSNSLYDNPAVKPFIEAAQEQFLSKHPNATNSQITDHVHDYLQAMGEAFAPEKVINDNGPADTDWSKFAS